MNFVLSLFTSIFISLQHVLRQSNWFCKPLGVVDSKATSSADNKINSSMTPGTSCIPCLPFSVTWFASWLMNKENSVGLSAHPWRTPTGHSKNSDYLQFARIQESNELYIALKALKKLPLIPWFLIQSKRLSCRTEWNAFIKSTNATYNFYPFLLMHFWTIA